MWYNINIETRGFLNTMASVGKENAMNEMSSFELETFLKMILEILNGCENLEEAKKKIKTLLER